LISQGKSGEVLRTKALQEGMVPLRQDGWNRVVAGVTTVEEVVRVTAADVDVLDE
jgi:type II secretory ATPase GspE/PulE/Tfp pilus assembly ATPase PilB-like protein